MTMTTTHSLILIKGNPICGNGTFATFIQKMLIQYKLRRRRVVTHMHTYMELIYGTRLAYFPVEVLYNAAAAPHSPDAAMLNKSRSTFYCFMLSYFSSFFASISITKLRMCVKL